MKQNYSSEKYQILSEINSISFERKLVNETAFDGIVKIYSLKTNFENINQKLDGHFFGDFFIQLKKGFFLESLTTKIHGLHQH